MIDYLLFPFRVLWSLVLHISDAVYDWWHVQIAFWALLEHTRHPERSINYLEWREQYREQHPELFADESQ